MENNIKELALSDISNQIRDFINDSTIIKTKVYLNKSKGYWEQLWTCMDTLGDSEIAINDFFDLTNDDFKKSPYLFVYGLLQSLILQQDAVINMKESLFETQIDWKQFSTILLDIRNIRNTTIGHPTKKRNGNSVEYCTINRSTLSKTGFSYLIWEKNGSSTNNVQFEEIVIKQKKVIRDELLEILTKLKNIENEHKLKFKGKKLSPMLQAGDLYSFQLLSQISFDDLAWITFKHYETEYKKIKLNIEDRYGKINETLRIPGTKLIIEELDFVFAKINLIKSDSATNPFELDIYADRLVDKLKELKINLDEIDHEFE